MGRRVQTARARRLKQCRACHRPADGIESATKSLWLSGIQFTAKHDQSYDHRARRTGPVIIDMHYHHHAARWLGSFLVRRREPYNSVHTMSHREIYYIGRGKGGDALLIAPRTAIFAIRPANAQSAQPWRTTVSPTGPQRRSIRTRRLRQPSRRIGSESQCSKTR